MRRNPRFMIALIIAGIGFLSYYMSRQTNPITGESQSIALTPEQEIALGLQSAPEMAAQFGGVDPDPQVREFVSQVGSRIVQNTVASQTPYEYQFHVLADPQTVNAFALPGGPIFITRGLLSRLHNEAQLAGILGHEVGHVIGRHSAERIAKDQLMQSLIGAVGMASDDPYAAQQMAALVANMVQMKYGREDEMQSDSLGVHLIVDAGYDPRELITVMEILEEASGGQQQPEFMSTHPNPGNRAAHIQEHIQRRFPNGVPENLSKGVSFLSS
jgi:predicted Zn-dependent protease